MGITDYLILPKGAKKKRKRRGKGIGSGHGKTSCRGHKGQKAHGNTKRHKGFEGGQMPLLRRLPKRGFVNIFKREYQVVNIESLNKLPAGSNVTPELLEEKRLIKDANLPTKILGNGKLQRKLEVHAHAFSKSAKKAVMDSGGKAIVIKKG